MLQRLGGKLIDVRCATRGRLVAGAEVGEYQIGQLRCLCEPGHLLRRAVLGPGANPVCDILGVGGLVNQYVGALAGIFQQFRGVVVTADNDVSRGSRDLGVVVAAQQAPVIQ